MTICILKMGWDYFRKSFEAHIWRGMPMHFSIESSPKP